MLDRYEKLILGELQRDASISVNELADRVLLSKSACWRRLQKLEAEGYILSKVALVDQHKVNLPLTVFVSIRTNRHDQDWLDKFRDITKDIPEILEIYRMSGDLDYLMRGVITDMAGYDALYKKLIARLDLFDVSSSFVMETVKHTTELPLDNA